MTSTLIRNAAAILTGQRGAYSRTAGPDIRIRGNLIDAIGQLTPEPGERVVVEGVQKLREGALVQPLTTAQVAEAQATERAKASHARQSETKSGKE